ncbi:PH domain-containing protein [Colwelliaceae bacterium MEBiC 14330]
MAKHDMNETMATEQPPLFSNQTLLITDIPSIERLEHQPLAASYARSNRIISFSIMLIFVMLALFVKYQTFFEISIVNKAMLLNTLWLISAFIALFGFYKSFADVKKFFALRQQDISFSSGLIFKKTVSQPILRIQHVELKRGPIERKIGLASLQVFSAGGAMHTFEIPGLKLDDAESIRQFILTHKDANHHG